MTITVRSVADEPKLDSSANSSLVASVATRQLVAATANKADSQQLCFFRDSKRDVWVFMSETFG